jgi:hypothetical protein
MGKPKVRLDTFAPTVGADVKRTAIPSKGSVGSRTWGNSNSTGRPVNKAKGSNSKLIGTITTLYFDGNDYLDLSSAEEMNYAEKWFWVFAFVDLDASADRVLAYTSDVGGYIGIASGGTGIIFKPNSSKSSEVTIATNNTNNSSVSHTFGSDVEVLIMSRSASSNQLSFYNIDGELIAQETVIGAGTAWNLDRIGMRNSADPFIGQLIDARFYNGSDCPPITTASLQAIGNNYKQLKD